MIPQECNKQKGAIFPASTVNERKKGVDEETADGTITREKNISQLFQLLSFKD